MTRLIVSHYMPPGHGVHTDFILPWARRVEAECPSLEIDVCCEGSLLGKLENQFEQVMSGAVDIAHSPASLPRDRFPLTNLINLPFLVENTRQATERLWRAHTRFLAREFEPLHVLALHADSGGVLHMRDGGLRTPEDLVGKRIRTPAGAIADVMRTLGAEPVPLLPPAIGAAARSREIDGAIMAWDVLAYTGTQTVFLHHYVDIFYVSPLYLVMNAQSRSRLTQEEREALDRMSGADLAWRFGDYWHNWSQPGRALADGPGHQVRPLPPSVLAALKAAAKVSVDRHVHRLVEQNLTDAPQVVAAFAGRDPVE